MLVTTTCSRWLCTLLVAGHVLTGKPAATQMAAPDGKFAIVDEGGFGQGRVDAVRAELHKGLGALATLDFVPRDGLFPIPVRLMPGGGVSNSFRGVIVLYQLHRNEAPIVHELTHIVAGYSRQLGHWTQEGFASFVQDRYGSNEAYPTYRIAHALALVIASEGRSFPMAEIMRERRREGNFSVGTPWNRWIAYVQSTSFVT
jgi:hypothetical protein